MDIFDEERFFEACKQLFEMQKNRYLLVKDRINYVIDKNIQDGELIEHILDELLDILFIYQDDIVKNDYERLCFYYQSINPNAALDYMTFYNEQQKPNDFTL